MRIKMGYGLWRAVYNIRQTSPAAKIPLYTRAKFIISFENALDMWKKYALL